MKKEEYGWYKKLKLSDKYKLNCGIGMALVSISILVISFFGPSILSFSLSTAYVGLALALLCVGLWLFGVGVRYQSQLDAIRIARRTSGKKRKSSPKQK
ncbi:hypothetical protein LAG90_19190 [Marinilongibacter aquaticus]|uniref:hypothetical protein n=1 Tax=Marinilongibacter aquaticus TaxID=2975157 RepID=UPI0021BDE5AE|nr:hypothetical protein [Marinilongibacter aquaticus]UBM58926.1 hypothetical protein LAG90_19190 [Marinilongibacter aquaticus]